MVPLGGRAQQQSATICISCSPAGCIHSLTIAPCLHLSIITGRSAKLPARLLRASFLVTAPRPHMPLILPWRRGGGAGHLPEQKLYTHGCKQVPSAGLPGTRPPSIPSSLDVLLKGVPAAAGAQRLDNRAGSELALQGASSRSSAEGEKCSADRKQAAAACPKQSCNVTDSLCHPHQLAHPRSPPNHSSRGRLVAQRARHAADTCMQHKYNSNSSTPRLVPQEGRLAADVQLVGRLPQAVGVIGHLLMRRGGKEGRQAAPQLLEAVQQNSPNKRSSSGGISTQQMCSSSSSLPGRCS